jgi:hypothetical protein
MKAMYEKFGWRRSASKKKKSELKKGSGNLNAKPSLLSKRAASDAKYTCLNEEEISHLLT